MHDEIKHYGRLGQRWGIRNPVGKDGLVGSNIYGKKDGAKVEVRKADGQKIQKMRMAKRVGIALGINEALAAVTTPIALAIGLNPVLGMGVTAARITAASQAHQSIQRAQTEVAKKRMERVLKMKLRDIDMKSVKNFRKIASRYGEIEIRQEGGKWVKINTGSFGSGGSRGAGSSKGKLSKKTKKTKKTKKALTPLYFNDFDILAEPYKNPNTD